eukprot:4914721-Amphidinium_carterae.3
MEVVTQHNAKLTLALCHQQSAARHRRFPSAGRKRPRLVIDDRSANSTRRECAQACWGIA